MRELHKIDKSRVVGLSSDGTNVVTGNKNGAAALMGREVNLYIQNIHCIAHQLALVTNQAAQDVPYLEK